MTWTPRSERGDRMNNEVMEMLAKELATRVNKAVNLPLINEENEQAFFELIILMVLDLVFARMEKEGW